MSAESVLGELLAAEHAAVYAYGQIGAHLDDATQPQALAGYDAHRRTRDALVALMSARTLPTPGPDPSYDVTVAGRAQALPLAIRIETGLSVLWRDLVGSTDERVLRTLGIRNLTDCSVRAALWRVTAGNHPVTVPFPGQA